MATRGLETHNQNTREKGEIMDIFDLKAEQEWTDLLHQFSREVNMPAAVFDRLCLSVDGPYVCADQSASFYNVGSLSSWSARATGRWFIRWQRRLLLVTAVFPRQDYALLKLEDLEFYSMVNTLFEFRGITVVGDLTRTNVHFKLILSVVSAPLGA